jgi:hypothetical protein
LDQQVFAFFTHILPRLAKSGVSINLKFNGLDAKQYALLDQLLNQFKDGIPENKSLGFRCPMPDIQYLTDFDNKMPIIALYPRMGSDIPILMKMLASPRPDGRQRVICLLLPQVAVSALWVSSLPPHIVAPSAGFCRFSKFEPRIWTRSPLF